MRTYLWTMLVIFALSVVGRAIYVANDTFPPRSRGTMVFDLIAEMLFAGWAAYLLFAQEVAHG